MSDQVFNPVPTLALRSAAISMFLRGEGAPKAPGELAAAEQPTAGLCAGCVAAIGPLWSGKENRRQEIVSNFGVVQIDEMELVGLLMGAALGHAPLEINRRTLGRETHRAGKAAVPAAREARQECAAACGGWRQGSGGRESVGGGHGSGRASATAARSA